MCSANSTVVYHQPELDDRTLTRVTIRKSVLKEDLGDNDKNGCWTEAN